MRIKNNKIKIYEKITKKYNSFLNGSVWNGEFGFHSLKETDISKWKDYEKFFGSKYNFRKFNNK